uniref:E3 ubiquitin-protein ligase n=1 Tax=Globisporangium ultimum (strain ATCC 200006 / CBS 805.95 / DAOM BR144) TaxID=431595 RepID=K3W6T7_GLOUD
MVTLRGKKTNAKAKSSAEKSAAAIGQQHASTGAVKANAKTSVNAASLSTQQVQAQELRKRREEEEQQRLLREKEERVLQLLRFTAHAALTLQKIPREYTVTSFCNTLLTALCGSGKDKKATPLQVMEKLTRNVRKRVCGAIFTCDEIAYSCRNCQVDSTDHTGHDVYFQRTTAGSSCDCGDPHAWKRDSFCSKHPGLDEADVGVPKKHKLPKNIGQAAPVFSVRLHNDDVHTLTEVINHISDAMDTSKANARSIVNEADKSGDAVVTSRDLLKSLTLLIQSDCVLRKQTVKSSHLLLREHMLGSQFRTEMLESYSAVNPKNGVLNVEHPALGNQKYKHCVDNMEYVLNIGAIPNELVCDMDNLTVWLACLQILQPEELRARKLQLVDVFRLMIDSLIERSTKLNEEVEKKKLAPLASLVESSESSVGVNQKSVLAKLFDLAILPSGQDDLSITRLEGILDKVSDFIPPSGLESGRYELKEGYLEKYNPYFLHLNREAHELARDKWTSYRKQCAQKKKAKGAKDSVPVEPLKSAATPMQFLRPVQQILMCDAEATRGSARAAAAATGNSAAPAAMTLEQRKEEARKRALAAMAKQQAAFQAMMSNMDDDDESEEKEADSSRIESASDDDESSDIVQLGKRRASIEADEELKKRQKIAEEACHKCILCHDTSTQGEMGVAAMDKAVGEHNLVGVFTIIMFCRWSFSLLEHSADAKVIWETSKRCCPINSETKREYRKFTKVLGSIDACLRGTILGLLVADTFTAFVVSSVIAADTITIWRFIPVFSVADILQRLYAEFFYVDKTEDTSLFQDKFSIAADSKSNERESEGSDTAISDVSRTRSGKAISGASQTKLHSSDGASPVVVVQDLMDTLKDAGEEDSEGYAVLLLLLRMIAADTSERLKPLSRSELIARLNRVKTANAVFVRRMKLFWRCLTDQEPSAARYGKVEIPDITEIANTSDAVLDQVWKWCVDRMNSKNFLGVAKTGDKCEHTDGASEAELNEAKSSFVAA